MASSTPSSPLPVRVTGVSYFNSKPLIEGLDREAGVALSLAVPAKLIDGLADGSSDVALLPVIDYQRLDGLSIVPAACIGCDGPTLTVRIFSRVPIEQIATLACDIESHTSVALARVLLAERYGRRPDFRPLAPPHSDIESLLLIGDKVVCEEPAGYPHQLDLGEAWRAMTGLPFVFAIWTARGGVDLGDVPQKLVAARRRGMSVIDRLVAEHALPRGWPADVARRYLTDYLKFDVGPRQIEAIGRFHALAAKHGVIDGPVRRLCVQDL
jgi:chorismate dehydratase